MSCPQGCSCIACHMRIQRQEKLDKGFSWGEILKSEADNPVLSYFLRPCDLFMFELNDKYLSYVSRIQYAWRAFQDNRKDICMDCGASFKDFLRYPNKPTHDGVARCNTCERCYENITFLTQ